MRVRNNVSRPLAALAGAAALLAGASGGAVAMAAPASVPPGPWSQTDYNAAASRANPAEATLTPATFGKVRYLRSIMSAPNPDGNCGEPPEMAAPALTGGNLYVLANGMLDDYSVTTGHRVWQSSPGSGNLMRSLAVSNGLVIAGGEECGSVSDPNGIMMAFDAATGAKRWSAVPASFGGPLDDMVVSRGLVVSIGTSVGSGGVVSAHEAGTGARVWSRTFQATGGRAVVVAGLVVFDGVTSSNTSFIEANSLSTGKRVWRRTGAWAVLRGDLSAASGTTVYARLGGTGGTVEDLNPLTGATRFTLAGATDVLAVGAKQAYAACGLITVCGYSLATGKQLWTFSDQPTLATEAGGVLYLADGQALNAATGAPIGAIPQNSTDTALAVGNGHIAVANDPRVLDIYGLPGS